MTPVCARTLRCRVRRGVTIAELMVGIAGLSIVMAIALGIYDSSQRASKTMMQTQASRDAASGALEEIRQTLRNAVNPADLDASGVAAVFKSDRFEVPTLNPAASEPVAMVSIAPVDQGWQRSERKLTGGEDLGVTRPLGSSSSSVKSIRFRYATQPPELGEQAIPTYVDELPAGQWPSVIEITIETDPGEEGRDPHILTSGVSPGVVRLGGAK